MNDKPTRVLTVCGACGQRWAPLAHDARVITLSPGRCDVCGTEAWVSPAYDYRWDNDGYAEALALRNRSIEDPPE